MTSLRFRRIDAGQLMIRPPIGAEKALLPTDSSALAECLPFSEGIRPATQTRLILSDDVIRAIFTVEPLSSFPAWPGPRPDQRQWALLSSLRLPPLAAPSTPPLLDALAGFLELHCIQKDLNGYLLALPLSGYREFQAQMSPQTYLQQLQHGALPSSPLENLFLRTCRPLAPPLFLESPPHPFPILFLQFNL